MPDVGDTLYNASQMQRYRSPLREAASEASLVPMDLARPPDASMSTQPPMSNRLRHFRTERKWTQAYLAEQLEVSRQTVNALERGKYYPSLPLAFRIARLFETRIEDVFGPLSR